MILFFRIKGIFKKMRLVLITQTHVAMTDLVNTANSFTIKKYTRINVKCLPFTAI